MVLNRTIDRQSLHHEFRKMPLFSDIGDDALMELISPATVHRFKKGQLLFWEGDKLDAYYIVMEGRVKIFKHTREGRQVTIRVLGPEETFGDISLFDDEPLHVSVQAIDETVAASITKKKLFEVASQNPAFAFRIVSLAGKKYKQLADTMIDLATCDVELRVFRIFSRFSYETDSSISITHQEIADMAGTSRETVTRVIKHMRDDGTIGFNRGKFEILDKVRLRHLARGQQLFQ